jgi:hypothetical protein
MYMYKTKDGSDMTVVGVGQTVNGQIRSARPIENPNLELVIDESAQAPANVHGDAPQGAQPITGTAEHKPNSEGV